MLAVRPKLIGLDTLLSYSASGLRFAESLLVASVLGPAGQGSYAIAKTTAVLAAQPLGGSMIAAVNRASVRQDIQPVPATNAVLGAIGGTGLILAPVAVLAGLLDVPLFLALVCGLTAIAVALAIGQTRSTILVAGPLVGYGIQAAVGGLFLIYLGALASRGVLTAGYALLGLGCMYLIDFGIGRYRTARLESPCLPRVSIADLRGSATLGLFLQNCVNRADVIVLGIVAGPSTAGVYSVALATAQPVQQFGQVLAAREARTLATMEKRTLVVPDRRLLGVAALSTICLYLALRLLFSEEYSGAVPAMLVLIPAALAQVGQVRITNYAMATGQQRSIEHAELLGLVVLVGATAVLGRWFGPLGAATASVLAYAARLNSSYRRLDGGQDG